MKNANLLFLALIVSFQLFGQNIKLKNDNITYKYDVYSELVGFEEHKFYHTTINDFNGNNYSYTEGTNPNEPIDIFYSGPIIYGKKWNFLKYELLFEVSLTSSTSKQNEVITFTDPTTKVNKYGYKIISNHTYDVRIIDVKNGNKLIKEFKLTSNPEAYWPGFPSATVGFASAKLLEDNYKNDQQTKEGFFKNIDAKLISNSYKKDIAPKIKMLLSDSDRRLIFFSTKVKAKDTKFDLLDSAVIYIDLGMEEIKKNDKAGIKGNHHPINAKNQFLKAHAIYSEYNKKEYLDLFTDPELKEEYLWGLKSNLYFSSFLIADYEKTNDIYNEIKAEVDAKIAANKNKTENIKAIMTRTPAEKAVDAMNEFRFYELREKEFFYVFKSRYSY